MSDLSPEIDRNHEDDPIDRKLFMENQSKCIQDGSWMHGKYFMPGDGYCYHCNFDLIENETKLGNDGSQLVTGCRGCHRSYCD